LECIGKTEEALANYGLSPVLCPENKSFFPFSCFFTGLAGALYAPYIMIVTPSQFSLWQGDNIVLVCWWAVFSSPLGAIIGTVFMRRH